jgi:hypothetical protein
LDGEALEIEEMTFAINEYTSVVLAAPASKG